MHYKASDNIGRPQSMDCKDRTTKCQTAVAYNFEGIRMILVDCAHMYSVHIVLVIVVVCIRCCRDAVSSCASERVRTGVTVLGAVGIHA